jgi:hypothetical protein
MGYSANCIGKAACAPLMSGVRTQEATMIAAHSLDSIVRNLDETLGVKYVNLPGIGPSSGSGIGPSSGPGIVPGSAFETHLFLPGLHPSQSRPAQTIKVRLEQWSKLVGVLFCPPTRRLGRDEIVPNLEYFHHRSGSFVDFFCVGYGAGWPSSATEQSQVVMTVDDVKWLFSSKEYNSLRAELEKVSRWKYSGETDLLLLVARKESQHAAYFDFSTAIACNLEKMQTDGAFSSVGAFFEQIFRFAQTCNSSDPVRTLSDQMGVKKGINFLEDGILSLLPEAVGKLYRSAKHYAIRDISI